MATPRSTYREEEKKPLKRTGCRCAAKQMPAAGVPADDEQCGRHRAVQDLTGIAITKCNGIVKCVSTMFSLPNEYESVRAIYTMVGTN